MITLRTLGTYCRGKLSTLQCLQLDEHVTLCALWEGAVSLLQDHYIFLHVVVHKVEPEGIPTISPPREPLHWTCQVVHQPREVNPMLPMLPLGVVGSGSPIGPLIPPHAIPANVSPGTPQPGPRHTPDSIHTCVVFLNGYYPTP